MIYFARAEGTNLVKIGYTAGDVAVRIAKLQTGSPHHLVLFGAVPGTTRDEKKWHRRFAANRHKGEWFRLTRKLATAVRRAAGSPASGRGKLYAFSQGEGGEVHYAGEVVHAGKSTLRLEVYDGLMLCAGLLSLSGEIRDVPRSQSRVFSNADAFGEAVSAAMARTPSAREEDDCPSPPF